MKITPSKLRQIINEEIQKLYEGDREDQAASMATAASKLLKALEVFQDVASEKAKSSSDSHNLSLIGHLKSAEKILKRVVASPLEYVDGPKASSTLDADQQHKKVSIQPDLKNK